MLKQQYKRERIVSFNIAHIDEYLHEISNKLIDDCSSDIPNAFWHWEEYVIDLPYAYNIKIKPQKASKL